MVEKLILPIILQILAVVVVIAEFILPSMGLLTVMALGLFGFSLYLVFSQASSMTGFIFVIVDVCMVPVLIIVGVKMLAASPVTLRSSLKSDKGALSQPPEWADLIGVTGEAVTDLHPSGSARFNGKRYDVVSRGDYIQKGTSVSVLSVEGNRIVVKQEI